jgi:hypothetical protein
MRDRDTESLVHVRQGLNIPADLGLTAPMRVLMSAFGVHAKTAASTTRPWPAQRQVPA